MRFKICFEWQTSPYNAVLSTPCARTAVVETWLLLPLCSTWHEKGASGMRAPRLRPLPPTPLPAAPRLTLPRSSCCFPSPLSPQCIMHQPSFTPVTSATPSTSQGLAGRGSQSVVQAASLAMCSCGCRGAW